ncbi:hypothetical protein SBV1_150002 [Verrucomicrobia bacterium]|nr:hypothetical protein SBV1_150002 [Verrucomicrobiota bacterium]
MNNAHLPLPGARGERAALCLEGGDYFRPLASLYLKGKGLGPALERLISILRQPV